MLYQRRSSTDNKLPVGGASSQGGSSSGAAAASSSSSSSGSHRPSIPTLDNATAQLRVLLEKSDKWAEFDILELERLTEKR